MFREGQVEPFPVYLDSPMAIKATEIYRNHPELYDTEARKVSAEGKLLDDLDTLVTCETADESRSLNSVDGPCMILAGSGMCTGGRILHHLKHHLWQEGSHVRIVGYQAEGSFGRLLVEGRKHVRIFGEKIAVKAKVHTLNGFSAHAGQTELVEWLSCVAGSHPRVVLTHGEDRGRKPMAELVRQRYGIEPEIPYLRDVIEL